MKKDMLLNIIASLASTFAVQLFCYPLLSGMMNADDYGLLLTVIGLCNTCANIFGTSLNNVRLITQQSYERLRVAGDFNLVFVAITIISSAISAAGAIALGYAPITGVIVGLIAIEAVFVAYHSVAFRLEINYKLVLFMNSVRAIGYLLGTLVAVLSQFWPAAFLFGEGASCLYLLFNSSTAREPYVKTGLFRSTLRDYAFVAWGNCAGGIMMYMDRFMLYPLIGPSSVAIYTVASYVGKSIGIVFNPISSVLLTYYSKESNGVSLRTFYLRLATMVACLALMLLSVVAVSRPLLSFLYPSLVDDALLYVVPASLAAVLSVLCGFIQPMVLSYAKSYWQTVIQIAFLSSYLLFGVIGIALNGLMGFCISLVMANAFRAILMFVVTRSSLKEKLECE